MGSNKTEYNRVHKWAERNMIKQGVCSTCQITIKTQWSNKDHQYKTKIDDWQELCPQCHRDYDIELFSHLWKKQGRKRKPRPPKPPQETDEQILARLRSYTWYNQEEFDNCAQVCILIHMRDNVYIKQKYYDVWRDLKAQGRIPELLEGLLKKELKTRQNALKTPPKPQKVK